MSTPAPTPGTAIETRAASLRAFLADVAIGGLAYFVVLFPSIAVVRDAPPGFGLLGPAAFFVAGFWRGGGKGNLWARSVRITLGSLCAMFFPYERFPSGAEWLDLLRWLSMALISSVLGIVSRRFWVRLFGGA